MQASIDTEMYSCYLIVNDLMCTRTISKPHKLINITLFNYRDDITNAPKPKTPILQPCRTHVHMH